MKNQKLKKSFRALPTMGMAFIVLGVLLLAASFAMNIKNNSMLYAGLFFILAGVAGYIYTIKKGWADCFDSSLSFFNQQNTLPVFPAY